MASPRACASYPARLCPYQALTLLHGGGWPLAGAKTTEEGVELWLQWADGERAVVPAARWGTLRRGAVPKLHVRLLHMADAAWAGSPHSCA